MEFPSNNHEDLSIPYHTVEELEELAHAVGCSAALGMHHRNTQGDSLKAAVWFSDAQGYSLRVKSIVNVYPEMKPYYKDVVNSVIDSYSDFI